MHETGSGHNRVFGIAVPSDIDGPAAATPYQRRTSRIPV
jgi:hypothetical protein